MKLCTAEQMRTVDARAVADYGMPSLLLMENAGRAVVERVLARLGADQTGRTVRILCGRGNNGGDGFVVARHLHNRGVRVLCSIAGDPATLKGDARTNRELLERLGVPVLSFVEGADARLEADLIVDALLGTGFTGVPHGVVADAIQAINVSGVPVVAVDVPSGLDSDTGCASEVCIRAAETVTFGLPKVGLVSYPGRELAGEITVANISLPRSLVEEVCIGAEWVDAGRAAPAWPRRSAESHKGDSGRLLVLAGSPGLTGAAAMASEAALRAGAGLVTLGIPHELLPILAMKLTEAMTLPLPSSPSGGHSPASLPAIRERLKSGGALAVGPGFGRAPEAGQLLRELFKGCPVPVVVDADALTLLSPADEHTFPARCVITPHPGEMARLLGTDVTSVQSNRIETARQAAARFGCVVLLKGAATVIAAPDGRLAVNSSGGPALATGGTGDVLTGIVGACLARDVEPFEAALSSAFLHGLAGELAGRLYGAPGTIAGDVIAEIPAALSAVQSGECASPWRMI